MQCTGIFEMQKKRESFPYIKFDNFLIFDQNIDCGYTLVGIPHYTPVLLHKMGYEGVYITRTCLHDEIKSIIAFL